MSDDPTYDFLSSGGSSVPAPSSDATLEFLKSGGEMPSGPPATWMQTNVERPLGLAARAIATGVGALPLTAMDAGVASRNMIGDAANKALGKPATPDYDMPSDMWQQSMDQMGLPRPQGAVEKGIGLAEAGMAGGAVPGPAVAGASKEFVSPAESATAQRLSPVSAGMKEGYVVPPSTTNPTLTNQTLETVSGKVATQQAASAKNQAVTNSLAKRALGISPDQPITPDALAAIRSSAAKDYQAISQAGTISMDDAFKTQVQGVLSKFNKTAEEMPSLANKDIEPVAQDLLGKSEFSADALLGAVKGLRNKADMAFRTGDGSTGSAYKQLAGAVEDSIDRNLSSRSDVDPGLVDNFRSARQRIAMSHTVEDALNPATGNVIASKLAGAVKRGEPLSGDLATIGNFAASVPKAVKEPLDSNISHLGMAVPFMTETAGALAGHPGLGLMGLGVPAARMASRAYLLGPGQKAALPEAFKPGSSALSSLLMASPSEAQNQ